MAVDGADTSWVEREGSCLDSDARWTAREKMVFTPAKIMAIALTSF